MTTRSKRWLGNRGVILGLTALLTLVLYGLPQLRFLAYPLLLVSTLAHELGHGLTALLVGGSFETLQIWSDASGAAAWAGQGGRLGRAAVAAGGLVGPALAAGLLFVLARRSAWAKKGFFGLGIALVLIDLIWVRNVFGFVFVALLAATCIALGRKASANVARFALVFFAMQLALSVFSRADYLFARVAQTGAGPMPSDTAQIAEALYLPHWFWGALCGALSLVTVVFGVRVYLTGSTRRRRSPSR